MRKFFKKPMLKNLLHVGCGHYSMMDIKGFAPSEWQEVRYDIDSAANPDILGTMTNMEMIASRSMDALYSAHNIEHLYSHEVPTALSEFYRVLKVDGVAIINCPDLISVCNVVAQDKLLETLYESPSGPIAPIDILFGHRKYLKQGNSHMAHKCGFSYKTLTAALIQAGFKHCWGGSRPNHYDIWVVAFKDEAMKEKDIIKNALEFLPT